MKAIKQTSIVQQVVEELKKYIISGAVKEGEKLQTESELCKQFSIGRSTLREAYQVLQVKGFVVMKPGKGAFVGKTKEVELDETIKWFIEHEVELIEFIEVRMAIEPLAAKLAANCATDSDIKELKHIHNEFLNAIKHDDKSQIILLDEEFHSFIIKITKNRLLESINEKINAYFKEFRKQTFQVHENINNAIEPHKAILEAIICKDGDIAEIEMKKHIEYVIRDLTKITGKGLQVSIISDTH